MHDAGPVGAVDADRVRHLRPRQAAERLHLRQRQRLQRKLAPDALEPLPKRVRVDVVRCRQHEHDCEVPAEDRHLGVLDVDAVREERLGHRRDDSGPVAAGGGERERSHRPMLRRRRHPWDCAPVVRPLLASTHRGAPTGG